VLGDQVDVLVVRGGCCLEVVELSLQLELLALLLGDFLPQFKPFVCSQFQLGTYVENEVWPGKLVLLEFVLHLLLVGFLGETGVHHFSHFHGAVHQCD